MAGQVSTKTFGRQDSFLAGQAKRAKAPFSRALSVVSKRRGVVNYLKVLSALERGGFLGNAAVYAPIGLDFFPSLFVKTFGFNNRRVSSFDFFPRASEELKIKTRGWDALLRERLQYIYAMDVKDVEKLGEQLVGRGFYSIAGSKTLILKGVFSDIFKQQFDLDCERYFLNEYAVVDSQAWIRRILGLFKAGDHVIAFDRDIDIVESVPEGVLKRLDFSSPVQSRYLVKEEIVVFSPETIGIRLYLPKEVAVFRVA